MNEREHPHTVVVGGMTMLPERLTEVDGKPYVRCYMHGLIPADHHCSFSPADHHCGQAGHPKQVEGESYEDQMVTHDELADIQSEKLSAIAEMHAKRIDPQGGTEGVCAECGLLWPCRTIHYANGWGDPQPCEDDGWCSHAGVAVIKWW